jgi:phage baseplate assembly protein W
MGNIILNNLPKSRKVSKNYYYADLHLDLQENYLIKDELYQKPEINDFKIDYDVDAIKNSLYNLFTTTPGHKILNPDYGMDLRKYLFVPATVEVARDLREEIFRQIRVYEPRVDLKEVKIIIYEDVNEFDVSIFFDIPVLRLTDISLFGTLNNNGYIFRN